MQTEYFFIERVNKKVCTLRWYRQPPYYDVTLNEINNKIKDKFIFVSFTKGVT